MQIDMGFGDVVVPSVISMEYPTILDHEPPRLNGYSRETTVAEKFEAMVDTVPYIHPEIHKDKGKHPSQNQRYCSHVKKARLIFF